MNTRPRYNFRGSLRKCLEQMLCRWNVTTEPYQSLLCNDKSGYYALADDAYLNAAPQHPDGEGMRLVLRCTLTECKTILSYHHETQQEMKL